MSHRLLTLIGNIGSGKSSALSIIAPALKAVPLDADNLFQTTDPFAKAYLKNTPRWALTNELWLTVKRYQLLTRHLAQHPQSPTIIDSGILMSWAYTYSHLLVGNISPDEWRLYENICDELAFPAISGSAVIHFDYSIPTLLKRIKSRGREFELKYYTPKYLSQINHGINSLKTKLKPTTTRLITITERDIPDFVNSRSGQKKLLAAVRQINP